MHWSTYVITINYDCMVAMRALEVQLWCFVYSDIATSLPRWEKDRIILRQKSLNTISCRFQSAYTSEIFLEPIMKC